MEVAVAEETTTPPPPVNETTIHPDDSLSLAPAEVFWGSDESIDKRLLRTKKEVFNSVEEPRTRYTYVSGEDGTREVVVEIPHGFPPLKISATEGGDARQLQPMKKEELVGEGIESPQIRYTYGEKGSDVRVTVVVPYRT